MSSFDREKLRFPEEDAEAKEVGVRDWVTDRLGLRGVIWEDG